MPRYDDDDDYDDRPRRPRKKKKTKTTSSWPKYLAGGIAFAVCFAIAFYAVSRLTNRSGAGGFGGGPAIGEPAPKGVKYVPHESEEKFSAFLKTRPDHTTITEAEVYAIMGEPTRREHIFTGTRNGVHMTVYEAFWEVPGSGISSSIDFMNGKCSGMVIGLRHSK